MTKAKSKDADDVIDAEIEEQSTALTVREVPALDMLTPVMNLQLAKSRLKEFQQFIGEYLVEGIDQDYGVIPGTVRKTLLQPGADKLNEIYGLVPRPVVVSKTEDYSSGLFDYTVRVDLKRGDRVAGSGFGSCSSWESRYRFRNAERLCPTCKQSTIIKGKEEYGGGWLCFKKKGGCGAKYAINDPAISDQEVGKVENDNLVDTKNTVLKMAVKRAKVAATIAATRSSGIFTQDLEDQMPDDPRPVQPEEPQVQVLKEQKDPLKVKRRPKKGGSEPKSPADIPLDVEPDPEPPPDLGGGHASSVNHGPQKVRTISQAQVKRFFTIGRSFNWSEAQLKALVRKTFKVEHTAEIPDGALYNTTCEQTLAQGPAKAGIQ